MSLDATRVALHQPPQNVMQQLMAAIAMSKQAQTREAQQRQQALQAQMPPTVTQQLQAAAAPAPMGGLAATAPEGSIPAMAAGGFVQRHFESGGVADTDETTLDRLGDSWMGRLIKGGTSGISAAVDKWKNYHSAPTTEYAPPADAADGTGFEAYMDDRTPRDPKLYRSNGTGIAKAPDKKTAVAKSGSGAAAKSGIAAAVKEAVEAEAKPETAYADRAKELQQRLDPLYAAQLKHIANQRDNENMQYAGLQKARELSTSDKLVQLGDQFTRAAQASVGIPGGGNGLRGLAAYGSIALKDRQAVEAAQNKEAFAHLKELGVIDSHSTDKQIAQAMEAYKTFNTAYGADDKTELNAAKMASAAKTAEAAQLRAEAAKTAADAKLKKGSATGAGGPKPMTWDQAQRAARARVKDIEAANAKDMGNRPVPDIDALARQLFQGPGAAVQSANPAVAPAAGASPGWGQIKRQ